MGMLALPGYDRRSCSVCTTAFIFQVARIIQLLLLLLLMTAAVDRVVIVAVRRQFDASADCKYPPTTYLLNYLSKAALQHCLTV